MLLVVYIRESKSFFFCFIVLYIKYKVRLGKILDYIVYLSLLFRVIGIVYLFIVNYIGKIIIINLVIILIREINFYDIDKRDKFLWILKVDFYF